MKRTILFRGKRKDNGEWVYGDYGTHFSIHYISWTTGYAPTLQDPGGETIDHVHSVDPETVGQFTGIKDKSGKFVYEGDCVKWVDKEMVHAGLVFFNDDSFGYRIQMPKGYMPSFNLRGEHIEVFANIYDNPELLK